MPLLSATNIFVRYGDTIILDGSVCISLEAGERVGMVGRNGCGKSTLLKVLAGLITPERGSVNLQRGCTAGYLKQDPDLLADDTVHDAAERAFAELHALHEQQHGLYERMAGVEGNELDKLMKQVAQVEARIEALGGYAVEHRIGSVLHGLGFQDAQFTLKVASLSGGQKGRLALGKLLLEQPDVLLLDEPTNHLDIDGRLWLESFLKDEFRGAVLLVSHDRMLLDNVVHRIVEVEQGRLIDYPGNYAAFREIRAQRRLTMLRAYDAQQDKFKKEEAYIRRYKAGQRAKQARGRQTRLEREKETNTLERPMELDVFAFELPRAPRSGDVVVSLREASKRYRAPDGSGEKILFDAFDVSVQRGERWGIIGPNGAGKTSLVRAMLGELELDHGVAKPGSSLAIGYYRQTHDGLDPDATVVEYLQRVILQEAPQVAMSEQKARDLAGAFLFSGEDQDRRLRDLSGGERGRAVLAGLLASAKNLLILDEPTNHLDIPSAERLEEALSLEGGYDGTLILISHDRAFLDAVCDRLIVLDGQGHARVVLGTYSEWASKQREEIAQRRAREAEQAAKREEQQRKRETAKQPHAGPTKADPSANALARMKTEQIEAKIEKIETRLRELDAELADPQTWRDAQRTDRLSQERAKLALELEPLEFEWSRRADSA